MHTIETDNYQLANGTWPVYDNCTMGYAISHGFLSALPNLHVLGSGCEGAVVHGRICRQLFIVLLTAVSAWERGSTPGSELSPAHLPEFLRHARIKTRFAWLGFYIKVGVVRQVSIRQTASANSWHPISQ